VVQVKTEPFVSVCGWGFKYPHGVLN